jgi:hypothetical protein
MKHITFYLDFISPYAWLAFKELPQALMGLSYTVAYKPVFLGGLLKHNAMLGPAEVPPKRDWTYRHVQWLAHKRGHPLDMPAQHPFNPLGLLRLAVASDPLGLRHLVSPRVGGRCRCGRPRAAGRSHTATRTGTRPGGCGSQGPAQGACRRGYCQRRVWRTRVRGRRQSVLGAGWLAHAARLSGWRCVV